MRKHALIGQLFLLSAMILIVSGCSQTHVHAPKFVPTEAELSDLLDVVDVRQATPYTCGTSCVQAILNYYGIDKREDVLAKQLGTTEEAGTSPDQIMAGFEMYGLIPTMNEHTTLDDLRVNLRNKIPTIVDLQAWLDDYPPQDWSTTWEDGHYVIVIGMDDKNLFFEDPSLLGTRGRLPPAEFLARWHDYEGDPPCCDDKDKTYTYLSISVKGTFVKRNRFTHID